MISYDQTLYLNKTLAPSSSYSFFVTHILLKAFNDETVAPPIQHEFFLLLGAIKVTFMSLGANFWMLLCRRSLKPINSVVPPAAMILLYRVFLRSISHFLMALITISCTPGYSRPILSGENNISGALYFSEDIFMDVPSGNTQEVCALSS